MRLFEISLFIALIVFAGCTRKSENPWANRPKAESFVLFDSALSAFDLERNADAKAIVLIAQTNGCPIGRKMYPRIEELRREFEPKGVRFRFLNAGIADELPDLVHEAHEFKLTIPILRDSTQLVTRALGLTTSTEAVVLDGPTRAILYRGPVDDSQDFNGEKLTGIHEYLKLALGEVLKGNLPAEVPSDLTKGCAISFENQSPVYFGEVDKILQEKCLSCHSHGSSAQDLSDYRAAKHWSAMISKTILLKQMPPWNFASPDARVMDKLVNKGLTESEARLLVNWVRSGAAEGDKDKASTPKRSQPGKEDENEIVTVHTPEVTVPASGMIPYRYFQIAGPLKTDLTFDRVEVKTRNENIHHIHFYNSDSPLAEGSFRKRAGFDMEKFRTLAWKPNFELTFPHYAISYPKGTYIIMEVHYKSSGRAGTFATEVAFHKIPKAGRKILKLGLIKAPPFTLEPMRRNQILGGEKTLQQDIHLVRLNFHMHLRGTEFKLFVKHKNQDDQLLVAMPYFGVKQDAHAIFKNPPLLHKGDTLKIKAVYDNSEFIKGNPNPRVAVPEGLQVETNEMCSVKYDYF